METMRVFKLRSMLIGTYYIIHRFEAKLGTFIACHTSLVPRFLMLVYCEQMAAECQAAAMETECNTAASGGQLPFSLLQMISPFRKKYFSQVPVEQIIPHLKTLRSFPIISEGSLTPT